MKLWMLLPVFGILSCRGEGEECGSTFKAGRGIIQTPNFPKKFQVPVKCRWIINATDLSDQSIIVYFTQLFVTRGLTFTEYEAYEPGTVGKRIHEVTEQNVTMVQWLLTRKSYLVIEFVLDELEGNHVRAADNLLDVYGFNLTYETGLEPRVNTCSVTACCFTGHCYATQDFQEYYCSCFPGFSDFDCGNGPLCETTKYSCENGGICRHVGDKLALCSCSEGFVGSRCEVPLPDCEYDDGCTEECLENSHPEPCNCGDDLSLVSSRVDYARYEVTIQPSSVRAVGRCYDNKVYCPLIALLQQLMTDYLVSENMTITEEFNVSVNITLGANINFSFVGLKSEKKFINKSLQRLVRQGFVGDIALNRSYFSFGYEPALYLKAVELNQESYVLEEGAEFILSCIAQGSPHMVFRWFKDGVFVNVSQSQRSMWTSLLPLNSADEYTALLGIEHADLLDQGRYTCQISDHGYQQCKTIALEVIESPQLKVYPLSLTVDKNSNFTIKCIMSVLPELSASYSWSKNNKIMKQSLKLEFWETLFPTGSMLTVNNIQKSTTYTCHLGPLSKSVRVEVMNQTVVPWCHEEQYWDKTSPGVTALVECPLKYTGVASRQCVLEAKDEARWLTPDFSQCVSDNLTMIRKEFLKIKNGYGVLPVSQIMADLLMYIDYHDSYPGEEESYMSLLRDVISYLNEQGAGTDVLGSTALFYASIDALLQCQNATFDFKKSEEVQQLLNRWGLLWGNQSQVTNQHLQFNTMVVDLFQFKTSLLREGIVQLLPQPGLKYPTWYSSHLTLHLTIDSLVNDSGSLAVIAFHNLSKLNIKPTTQNISRLGYEMSSNMMSIVASENISIISEVEFEWVKKESKEVRCGISQDWGASWNLTACTTSQLSFNVTLSSCPIVGSYTMFVIKEFNQRGPSDKLRTSGIVLIGCVCCLVQSLLTLMFLTFHWLHVPRCYVLFLKVQCCCAVSLAMVMFLYAICTMSEQNVFPYISGGLQIFTLIAMSSQLCKLLLVYIEVVYIPKLSHLKPTLVSVLTGAPILIVLCTHLAQNTSQRNKNSVWLGPSTLLLCTYLFCIFILLAVFTIVYIKVYKHLAVLITNKSVDSKRAVKERVGLVKRSAFIVSGITLMVLCSLFYQKWPDTVFQYFFSLSCALVGSLLILCYIVHSESAIQIQRLPILRFDNADLGYNSECDSPPTFCRKQETAPCVSRSTDIGLVSITPRLTIKSQSVGLAHSGDSNDSGVQVELMSNGKTRSVTFHNDLVTGYDNGEMYSRRFPKIRKINSEIQLVPKNKNTLYPSFKQPEKKAVCVLIDRPPVDVGLKTELRILS